jgi:heme/copper-type cytochrome/quinol oxidase subunit 2
MLLIPVLCSTRIYANAIDVIHSIGLCSIGIRIDVIPGRNIAMTFNSIMKGEHRGFCYELCYLMFH